MTYEKFEHKVLGMLLEGNDPRLEKLLTQALDREVVLRKETETGFVVDFLVPSILAIDEKEGRVFGVEVAKQDQLFLYLELIVKDGLVHSLEGTYETQATYSEVVSQYNELSFIYTNEKSSEISFHSDTHDPNEVTFVKNIATISKEIDANISRRAIEKKPLDEEIIVEEGHGLDDFEPKQETPALETEMQTESLEEETSLQYQYDPSGTEKKLSRLALKVEELKKAALEKEAEKEVLPELVEEQPPLFEEPQEIEPVILEEPAKEPEEVELEEVESEEIIEAEIKELIDIIEETTGYRLQTSTLEDPISEPSTADETYETIKESVLVELKEEIDDVEVDLDKAGAQTYIEALEQELSQKMSTDPEPQQPLVEVEVESIVEEPIRTKSYIEELEESILRKLEAEDPTFIRREALFATEPSEPEVEIIEPLPTEVEESQLEKEVENEPIVVEENVEDKIREELEKELISLAAEREEAANREEAAGGEKVSIEDDNVEVLEQSSIEEDPEKQLGAVEEALEKSEKVLTETVKEEPVPVMPEVLPDRIAGKVDDALIDSEAIVNTEKVAAESVKSLRPASVMTPEQTPPPKRMSLGEYMKNTQEAHGEPNEDVVQESIQTMVQNAKPQPAMQPTSYTLQSIQEKEKMSIGTKVGIFLIILGIIVLIIFIVTRPT